MACRFMAFTVVSQELCRKRKLMRVTLVLWFVALFSGVVFYTLRL